MPLHTVYGIFDTEDDYAKFQWRGRIAGERQRQIEKWGYDAAHDAEHGVDHLLLWAQEYARIGKSLESAALIEAARELLTAPTPVVPEQPQLPTEPGVYMVSTATVASGPLIGTLYGGHWRISPEVGNAEEVMTTHARTSGLVALVPAGSERETALREFADYLAADAPNAQLGAALNTARKHFALVPEAEGKK